MRMRYASFLSLRGTLFAFYLGRVYVVHRSYQMFYRRNWRNILPLKFTNFAVSSRILYIFLIRIFLIHDDIHRFTAGFRRVASRSCCPIWRLLDNCQWYGSVSVLSIRYIRFYLSIMVASPNTLVSVWRPSLIKPLPKVHTRMATSSRRTLPTYVSLTANWNLASNNLPLKWPIQVWP